MQDGHIYNASWKILSSWLSTYSKYYVVHYNQVTNNTDHNINAFLHCDWRSSNTQCEVQALLSKLNLRGMKISGHVLTSWSMASPNWHAFWNPFPSY